MRDRTDPPQNEPSPDDAEQADESGDDRPDAWPTEHREPAPSPAQHNARVEAERKARG